MEPFRRSERDNENVSCWACGARGRLLAPSVHESLLACTSCGFAFQAQRDKTSLRELYHDAYFARYHEGRAYADARESRKVEAQVRLSLVRQYRTRGRLLEVGSASGHFLDAARRAGFEVLGVEPGETMARAARMRFGVEVVDGVLDEVELGSETFDVACAWHVLEHLITPVEPLQRIRESLRTGGYLLVEVPNFGSQRALREGAAWRLLDLRHHVGHYSPASLSALLTRAGFAWSTCYTAPWAEYVRAPRSLLSHAKQAVVLRGWPASAHPWKHELLRGVARTLG